MLADLRAVANAMDEDLVSTGPRILFTTGPTVLAFGDNGVLVDPDDDPRTWFRGAYADGELVTSASSEVDTTREVLVSGDLKAITSVAVDAGMAVIAYLNMCYWFYMCTNLTSCDGLGNLTGVRSMSFAFASCSSVITLGLRGFDPSALTALNYTFSSCSALATIFVGPTWALSALGSRDLRRSAARRRSWAATGRLGRRRAWDTSTASSMRLGRRGTRRPTNG